MINIHVPPFFIYLPTHFTADDESLPPLPSSPVSATIRIGPDEDDEEDSQSVKSLTIIRTSSEELSGPAVTNPAHAVSGITIQVDGGITPHAGECVRVSLKGFRTFETSFLLRMFNSCCTTREAAVFTL